VNPNELVELQRRAAEQGRQLAGRLTAHQIHLEEALLRMHETHRPGHGGATVRRNGHHADLVPRDADLLVQPGNRHYAIEDRQAGAQLPVRPGQQHSRQQYREQRQASRPLPEFLH